MSFFILKSLQDSFIINATSNISFKVERQIYCYQLGFFFFFVKASHIIKGTKVLKKKFGYKFSKTTTLTKQINMGIYFKNLTIELHVLYVFKTYVKFMSIRCYLLFDS